MPLYSFAAAKYFLWVFMRAIVADDAEIVVNGILEICGSFNRFRRNDVLLNAISATPFETISHWRFAGAIEAGGIVTLISPPEIAASFFLEWKYKTFRG